MEHTLWNGSLTIGSDVYEIFNGKDLYEDYVKVTRYTGTTRKLPYEIRRETTADPRYGTLGRFMPEGIVRLKVGENAYIEIGNSSEW